VSIGLREDGIGQVVDRFGMALSLCCGLHCIVTPLLIGAAAAFPVGWLFEESTEALLLVAAITTAAMSLGSSYWRRHRRKRCLGLFGVGVGLLVLAKVGFAGDRMEPWTVASGATLLATAHLVNLHLCQQCVQCRTEEPRA